MIKKRRSVLMSLLTLMLCMALLASGTYALFSDQVTLSTHLHAGDLDITLIRTHLVAKTLDNATGYLMNKVNPEDVDFSRPTTRNVFDLSESDKIVPGCKYTATLELINNTDVAFAYWIEIVPTGEDGVALADQLEITVQLDSSSHSDIVRHGLIVGSASQPIGILAKTDSGSFDVTLEFLDLINNNDAKKQNYSFDLVVHAVQVLEAPSN